MAAGRPKGRKRESPSGSNGGPAPNRKLKGREEKKNARMQAAGDKIVHQAMEKTFSEPAYPQRTRHQWTEVQMAAARLYAMGFPRPQIARTLRDYIVPPEKKDTEGFLYSPEKRLRNARATLRRWEQEQWFRDKIYDLAVVKTDLEIPAIMEGVVKKAKRGRVDAAKLALQMAGRMATEDSAGGNVTVVFGNIPRPGNRGNVEIDEATEDAEWEEVDE